MASPLLDLKRELFTLQQKGRKFLAIEKLVQYCDIADEGPSGDQRTEAEDRNYKHRMDVWRVEIESGPQGTQFVNDFCIPSTKDLGPSRRWFIRNGVGFSWCSLGRCDTRYPRRAGPPDSDTSDRRSLAQRSPTV